MHAFVDESERSGRYLMCAILVAHSNLATTRRALASLCLAGQRRIHLTKERPSRRRLILDRVSAMRLRARIHVSTSGKGARDACLRTLVPDLASLGVGRLVIEPIESLVTHDKDVVYDALRRLDGLGRLAYEHVEARHEPILWAADAIAWAWGAGNDWRRRVTRVVEEEIFSNACLVQRRVNPSGVRPSPVGRAVRRSRWRLRGFRWASRWAEC